LKGAPCSRAASHRGCPPTRFWRTVQREDSPFAMLLCTMYNSFPFILSGLFVLIELQVILVSQTRNLRFQSAFSQDRRTPRHLQNDSLLLKLLCCALVRSWSAARAFILTHERREDRYRARRLTHPRIFASPSSRLNPSRRVRTRRPSSFAGSLLPASYVRKNIGKAERNCSVYCTA